MRISLSLCLSVSLSLFADCVSPNAAAQTATITAGSLLCDPVEHPGKKKLTWSGTFSDIPSGYEVIGCYAPVYYGSPPIYHSPGRGINDSSEPTTDPGSTGGQEVEHVPMLDSSGQTLDFVYVWFEYGYWNYNNGLYGWICEGELCSWHCIYNPGGSCFSEGTLVLTSKGSVPIETLKIGDRILTVSRDTPEAVPSARRVEQINSARERIFDLGLEGQTIHTTREHPFYTRDKGWVSAGSLAVGDKLRSSTNYNYWSQVEWIGSGADSKVFNVVVDGKSAYFVSGRNGELSILASDACSKSDRSSLKERLHATQ